MTLQNMRHIHPINNFIHAIDSMKTNYVAQRQTKAAYDKVYYELSAMSDRELTDIGLGRADIPQVAAEAVALQSV